MDVGIVGGTGPAGRGLAIRLAAAGVSVGIGSRDADRAKGVVAALTEVWGKRITGSLSGHSNEDAARAGLVVLATPWDSVVSSARSLSGALEGKVVVSMANALVKEGREMLPLLHARGSVASAVAAAIPGSRVAASFHHLPARDMEDLDSGLVSDVLVCSDDPGATKETMALVGLIEGLRPIDAGSLSQAGAIESFTAVCVTLNMRHKAHVSLRLAGI